MRLEGGDFQLDRERFKQEDIEQMEEQMMLEHKNTIK